MTYSSNAYNKHAAWTYYKILYFQMNAFNECFRNPDKGVEIAFLGTRTGLSRTNLFVVPEQLTKQWAEPNFNRPIRKQFLGLSGKLISILDDGHLI